MFFLAFSRYLSAANGKWDVILLLLYNKTSMYGLMDQSLARITKFFLLALTRSFF